MSLHQDRIGVIRRRVVDVVCDNWAVVNERDAMSGLFHLGELEARADMTAEQVMRSGPTTD
jgi:hypothetical protein